MVNYFTRTSQGNICVPAEISVAEFSLKDGVLRKYHTFVNPGGKMYGLALDAQEHAEETHNLPVPPNAMGEKDLSKIYRDIVEFVSSDDGVAPVYTHQESLPIVESVLQYLVVERANTEAVIQVYPIQYLLFIMKEASCEIGEMDIKLSHHVTDAYFENDVFEYYAGLSCTFHEDLDKSKFCTQSIVTRWGYMFAKYMCPDVAISLIPGRHEPERNNVAYIVIPGQYEKNQSQGVASKRENTFKSENECFPKKLKLNEY